MKLAIGKITNDGFRKGTIIFGSIFACNLTAALCGELSASTLLYQYDTLPSDKRHAIELTVRTAEAAMREASSTLVSQRSEYGLYCPPLKDGIIAEEFTANDLIELIRRQVDESPFIGKEEFEIAGRSGDAGRR